MPLWEHSAKIICLLAIVLLGFCGIACAGPISWAQLNANGSAGFTAWIYETDANGNPSEVSSLVTLPDEMPNGHLVLLDLSILPPRGSPAFWDFNNWSDILILPPDGNVVSGTGQKLSDTMYLVSRGSTQFDNLANMHIFDNDGPDPFSGWILESAMNPYSFSITLDNGNSYSNSIYVYSDDSYAAPEPCTLLLLGSGLLGLVAFRKKFRA